MKPTLGRRTAPPSIDGWLSAQRLENLVAQRTHELELVIAQLRERQSELEAMANHDCLTGLASRRLLKDRFHCSLERAKRSGSSFAVLVIDLDGFKSVNDSYGHALGDAVLVEVAKRIASAVRTSDTAARLGGDEFAVIVERLDGLSPAFMISEKIRTAVRAPIALANGQTVSVGATVGYSMYPDDGTDLDGLLKLADQSMYASKSGSRSAWSGAALDNAKAATAARAAPC